MNNKKCTVLFHPCGIHPLDAAIDSAYGTTVTGTIIDSKFVPRLEDWVD